MTPLIERATCRNGHEVAAVGVYTYPDGDQACRQCRRDAMARQYAEDGTPLCLKGLHRMEPPNLWVRPADGSIRCRPCGIEAARNYHWANRDRIIARKRARRAEAKASGGGRP